MFINWKERAMYTITQLETQSRRGEEQIALLRDAELARRERTAAGAPSGTLRRTARALVRLPRAVPRAA